ncbi:MAG: cation:proton antiporter family protein [Nitrosomonas sp.]|uniref:cation:proton antiporter n=2 Tax=Nitrosomonas sp. TaxID=42353 RepID=UPI002736284B|nr:cation:proton antiporter family protein [Nitrosomonas sp.]MDP3664955.1 cation:proton antiporter [Nitrosomonas sp.]MDZ4107272.1 cation:proton antiporter family protein [Nitrosomonas sp.]
MHGVFGEFALLLLMSAAAGAMLLWLRQPVLIAYIVIGIVAGPAVLGVVTAHDQIDLLAQVGVAVLLFVVGLKLELQHIRHIGPVALATGLGQLAFTIVIGFLIILAMGKGWMEALYVAVALTFSSTIIIVKLLSDKREIDSLHGRIAVGFLIVQDLAVVIAMMVMSAMRSDGGEGSLLALAGSLSLRLGIAVVGMYLLMRYVLPRVVDRMAQSQELLLIFAIAWGTGLAALGEWAGFSKEAGAFLAGFSLASTHYRDAINARLTGIRDFLLLFFFIDLGAKLDFSTLGGEIWPAAVLSLFVLIGNPLIVMAIMGYMGYRRRTGFLCGLTVAQISEFSIIFVAMGISLGHVDNGALGLTTLVGLVTIALSTYMILYSHPLYERLAPWLVIFERKRPFRELAVATERHDLREVDVIVFGLGRYGSRLALGLKKAELKVLGVEFDPEVVRSLRRQGLPVRYGDGIASEFLESLPLKDTRWVVSTLPDMASNRDLLRGLRELHFTGEVAVVAREELDDAPLKKLGVPIILYPMRNAVDYAVETLNAIIHPKEDKP